MAVGFNENGELQEYSREETLVACARCGKLYKQITEEQIPGFRDKSYDICPCCGATNGMSMEVEYTNVNIMKDAF